jgi:diacylglycerol kinase (ATP)
MMKSDICIIFNPAAKGGKARHFRRHLDEFARDYVLKPTWAPGAATQLAAAAVREGFATIVAAGGDGTLNEVVNGIAQVPDGFTRARLGLVPLGTVNVFAKELGVPTQIHHAWPVLKQGRERSIDLAAADFGPPDRRERRFFVQLAGAGLDSQAIAGVSWELKKKLGPLAYVLAGFKAYLNPHPLINLMVESQSINGELVLVGNGRYYGGRLALFPDASLEDGLLDICVFPKLTWLVLFRCMISLAIRRRRSDYGVQTMRARAFSLSSSAPVFLEMEGENVGQLPVHFSMLPRALRVVVP